ncbi:MAG: hypothetical protein H6995_07605 [Pseudomonadales bacterium]|nr:hypothetical protein [Pseudomonadales bacterium]MCP5214857.1 hypothetical protein [Pseudomonadales bacterium]
MLLLVQGCSYTVPEPKPYQLENLNKGAIAGDLVIASQPSQEALAHFAGQGYRTVISTRSEDEIDWDEAALVKELGMEYFQVPMPKSLNAISDTQVKQLNLALKNSKKPILLHSGSANRAASLWTVWLVEVKGVATQEALRLGRLMGMTTMRTLVDERLGLTREKKET